MPIRRVGAAAAMWVALATGCGEAMVATPGADAPDLSQTSEAVRDGRLDAALIVFDDRNGAEALGRAWARYLVHDRNVPATRVHFLPARRADARRVDRALARARRTIRTGGALWLVTIGYGSTMEDGTGVLRFGEDDDALAVDDVIAKLGWGPQSSSIWIADACARDAATPELAGLRATTHGTTTQRATATASGGTGGTELEEQSDRETPPPPTAGLWSDPQALEHAAAAWASPTDIAVITSGLGRRCADVDGSDYPWLAYAVLGGVRGWADEDGDGRVSTAEAALYAARWQDAHDPVATVSTAGTNLVLARVDAPEGDPLPPPVPAEPPDVEGPSGLAHTIASPAAGITTRAAPSRPLTIEMGFDDRVHVPSGWSRMGCVTGDLHCEPDEKSAHHVFLEQFTIDRHEVTWGEYADCVDAGACTTIKLDACYVWTRKRGFVRGADFDRAMIAEDQPVVCVSWPAAAEYCEWTGQQLPTEAQWERAARGDTHTRYPWGDAEPTCDRARHDGCGEVTRSVYAANVGASPTGVEDMAGNVWEWVADWYDEDAYDNRRGRYEPRGPNGGEVRVLRGGSFYDSASSLRTSYRYGLSPQYGYSNVGFRCARQ